MGKGGSDDKRLFPCFPKGSFGTTFIAVIIVFAVYGATQWAWEQVAEVDDKAQKKWVKGTCKVLNRKIMETVARRLDEGEEWDEIPYEPRLLRTSSSRKRKYYNAKFKVKRISQDGVEGNATLVEMDSGSKPKAWKYPFMTSGSVSLFGLKVWYTSKDEAKTIKKKYRTGDIVTCYWNPNDTDEVSFTNKGGDWIREEKVVKGIWMVSISLVLCCGSILAYGCFSICLSQLHEDHPMNKHMARPYVAHADSYKGFVKEKAIFAHQASMKFVSLGPRAPSGNVETEVAQVEVKNQL